MSLLEVRGLTKSFGGLTALHDLDMRVEPGEIVGLIGPNGSGKTTLFNCVEGVLRADRGEVRLRGENLVGLDPHQVCMRGVGRTFQLTRIFPGLTAVQNVLAGRRHQGESVWEAFLRGTEAAARRRAMELLGFVGLADLAGEPAAELSYGQQRLLELAMVLMGDPELLLLDEPTAGVNPVLVEKLLDRLREINRRGATIVMIEHNMDAVMGLSGRMYALAMGEKVAEGSPAEVRANPAVLEAYFGTTRPAPSVPRPRG
jgi:ABC-type branched-subunit amino acid transport system ATPase component